MAPKTVPTQQEREIAARLTATREALGFTQQEMATSVGVERTAWANWEAARNLPNMLALARLRERYGVTLDWIIVGDPSGLRHSLATKIPALLSDFSKVGKEA
ncbi:MAG TPA: helix-turn-helix transcriptional regulator [Stellaceae bacterium]|nr:helix-turn-helix transcriptional regulator [Stellaceae bacterium]